jgi:hypothetical protein
MHKVENKEEYWKLEESSAKLFQRQTYQVDLSAETLKARKAWSDVFQAPKQNNCQPRLIYLAKLCFQIEGEITTFHDKHKLKQFMTTKPEL